MAAPPGHLLPQETLEPDPICDALIRLAEGAWEPTDWIAWWATNQSLAEQSLKRAWLLRVRPRTEGVSGPFQVAADSQSGACYVLDALGVSYNLSDRYRLGAQEEFEAYCRAQKAKQVELQRVYRPILAGLQSHFPRFAQFLRRRLEDIDELAPGYTETELDALELALKLRLPADYRQWLGCVRILSLDGLTFGLEHPFLVENHGPDGLPLAGMLCLADYHLDADGDQVVMAADPRDECQAPVLYYAHGVPEVRPLAASFQQWIERLPQAPVLKR
jgi:hypothetical protein